jgi:excisionase family DNA binding protein
MDDGRLPYTRIGTKRLIPRRALLEFLQRNLVPARDPSAA